jgi:hypothetical protein
MRYELGVIRDIIIENFIPSIEIYFIFVSIFFFAWLGKEGGFSISTFEILG